MQSLATTRESKPLFKFLRDQAAAMPARELERIRRRLKIYGSSLDASHPPPIFRMEFIEKHGPEDSSVVLDEAEAKLFEKEILTLEAPIQDELIDKYRNQLYY